MYNNMYIYYEYFMDEKEAMVYSSLDYNWYNPDLKPYFTNRNI